jgi:hypothetical protein
MLVMGWDVIDSSNDWWWKWGGKVLVQIQV